MNTSRPTRKKVKENRIDSVDFEEPMLGSVKVSKGNSRYKTAVHIDQALSKIHELFHALCHLSHTPST
jgi:hypothetical protein